MSLAQFLDERDGDEEEAGCPVSIDLVEWVNAESFYGHVIRTDSAGRVLFRNLGTEQSKNKTE